MDISDVAARYLLSCGIPSFCDVPDPRPSSFVRIERTGGARSKEVIEEAMLAIDCWGETRADAVALSERAKDFLENLPYANQNIFGCFIQSTYNNPDPESEQMRTTVVCLVTFNR